MSNLTDAYLECLHEGKIWDKNKAFVKKHKSKLVAGAGIAAAVATGVAAKSGYDKYKNNPERIAAKKQKKDVETQRYNAARQEYNKRHRNDNKPSNIKAAGYAAKETVKTLGKPIVKAAYSGVKLLGKGVNYVASAAGRSVKKKVNNKLADYKFERMRNKKAALGRKLAAKRRAERIA